MREEEGRVTTHRPRWTDFPPALSSSFGFVRAVGRGDGNPGRLFKLPANELRTQSLCLSEKVNPRGASYEQLQDRLGVVVGSSSFHMKQSRAERETGMGDVMWM